MNPFFEKPAPRCFLITILSSIFFIPVYSFAAQEGQTARIISQIPPPISVIKPAEEKMEIFADSYYEFSDIVQGSRNGSWKEVTNLVGAAKGKLKGYFSVSQLRRFNQRNYTANFGGYLTMKDAYAHFETGFGWNISYIYRLQDTIEYAHRIYKGLYGQLGYNYRAYSAGDNHLIYPGFTYYFGNNYISANYGAAIIESRGTGNMGMLKLNLAVNDRLNWWFGGAYGQWLYDIFGLPANDEFGYLLYSGFTVNINKWVCARIGYSYGTEKPKFLKRNLMYGLSFKF